GIAGDGSQIGFLFGREEGRGDSGIRIAVVSRAENVRVASRVGLVGDLAVVRHVEAVTAQARLPGRADGAGCGGDTVVLERAERHARGRVGLDVEVVEQAGLQAARVERIEAGAIG